MRTPTGRTRRAAVAMVAAAALLLAPLATGTAGAQQASATEQARQHFTRGKQLFASSEYRGAIAEFAAADKLAPSPLLEFNIALCHERLGERAEAVRRYRLYLERVPDAANRAAVENKISRLEAEMKAEADAKRAAPAPAAPPVGGGAVIPPVGGVEATPPAPGEGANPDAEPPPASTGDPELDRVAKIDIGRLRAERQASGSGPPTAGGPPPAAGRPPPPAAESRSAPPPADRGAEKKKSKPVYKQWWFWVIAGVGAIILINIATSDSDSNGNRALVMPLGGTARDAPQGGGAVLLRF